MKVEAAKLERIINYDVTEKNEFKEAVLKTVMEANPDVVLKMKGANMSYVETLWKIFGTHEYIVKQIDKLAVVERRALVATNCKLKPYAFY
jgi:hypothetical protein